jgi:DNA repair exonuclease SbcCD ATPase subunit
MLQFNKVVVHNFGSYGHAEVDLANKGFCLVSGRNNYKKDNALSNGSGKSFLWSAICFALTGETINGLRSNLKNINADEDDNNSYVVLDFKSGADSYSIKRIIAPKSDLKITRNGVDASGKGLRESEDKLANYLPDLTKDLIASTIIIGQGMPNKFSSFSPSGRKELLEKLTKSDFMIEDLKNRIINRQADLNLNLRNYEDSLLVHRTQYDTTKKHHDKLDEEISKLVQPDFDKEIKESGDKVAKLQKQYDEQIAEIKRLEQENETNNTELTKQSDEKLKVSTEELTAYGNSTTELTHEKARLGGRITSLTYEIKRLKAVTDVCPTCGQKIQGVVKPDTSQQEQELTESNRQMVDITKRLNEAADKHKEYVKSINAAFDDTINNLRQTILNNKKAINKLREESTRCFETLSTEKAAYSKLVFDKENWDKYVAGIKSSIEADNEALAKLDSTITVMSAARQDTLEHIAIVKKMDTLVKRNFRGYLLSNIIGYIDRRAKDYCNTVFGTRELNIYLNGNSLDISYCGKMFDNLSGGEKQRVDLILQFAIRDMLMSYLNMNSNILVLDEITDFLDKQSCAAVMKLIEKELNTIESVFIISHHAEELELPIDSELHVVKDENGISEVY